ncbi:unnamed protein product [Prorocentrum cordatum]|uniref:Uncharacterized protein n=1 Tax=Prorocentrum cordatum TaxID=2364126 RepID=A0ABN9U569_9DINO|nr:unnamed protein product [Polarella glacialis]
MAPQLGRLQAELRRARQEQRAALHANEAGAPPPAEPKQCKATLEVLRASLKALQQRLTEMGQPPKCRVPQASQVMYVLDSCSRTPFNRLYEDALRRREQLAQWPPSAQDGASYSGFPITARTLRGRSQSEPPMTFMSEEVHDMLVANACSSTVA